MVLGFRSFEEFAEWYAELCKLRIFWAKPVRSIRLVCREGCLSLIEVEWLVRSRVQRAMLGVVEDGCEAARAIELLRGYGDCVKVIMVPECKPVDLGVVDARSILYFWSTGAATLEPNRDVVVRVYRELSVEVLEAARIVQKQSWGFFKPPRPRDHVVLVGYLKGAPVASAYLNSNNFNLDYGIHVARRYWRIRIGTRMLVEALKLAELEGADRVSVVRVFRRVRGASSDVRAVEFYKANNPASTISVYRLSRTRSTRCLALRQP